MDCGMVWIQATVIPISCWSVSILFSVASSCPVTRVIVTRCVTIGVVIDPRRSSVQPRATAAWHSTPMVMTIWITGSLVWVYVKLHWAFWTNGMVILECDVHGMFFFRENIAFYLIRSIRDINQWEYADWSHSLIRGMKFFTSTVPDCLNPPKPTNVAFNVVVKGGFLSKKYLSIVCRYLMVISHVISRCCRLVPCQIFLFQKT